MSENFPFWAQGLLPPCKGTRENGWCWLDLPGSWWRFARGRTSCLFAPAESYLIHNGNALIPLFDCLFGMLLLAIKPTPFPLASCPPVPLDELGSPTSIGHSLACQPFLNGLISMIVTAKLHFPPIDVICSLEHDPAK